MSVALQSIIGSSKNNPYLTVYRDTKKRQILVYHGLALMEVIPDKKDNPQLKLLAGRLYNTKVKAAQITREFGYCHQSIKRWAEALKEGTNEDIYYSLQGQGAPKKLTKEIEGFVSYEFNRIYPTNKQSYSKEIRQSIKQVFQKSISSETLRPLFNTLKENYQKQIHQEIKKK
jgi:transposase